MSNESEDTELPNLRFLGQTPIASKHDAKKAKTDSSPSPECLDDVFLSKIDKIFESRISILIPTCIGQLRNNLIPIIRTEIQAAIPNAIQQAIEAIKEELKAEIMQKIEDDLFYQEER